MPDNSGPRRSRLLNFNASRLPWWAFVMLGLFAYVGYLIVADEGTRSIYQFVSGIDLPFVFRGIFITLAVTLGSFGVGLILGAITGMMRSSNNVILYNIASLYVELLRGIPLLVVLLYVVFVITPVAASGLQTLLQLVFPEVEVTTRSVPLVVRAMLGIGILYGAFMAEIFRSGIQSIDKGQLEAARGLGLNYRSMMMFIIIPQAARRITPPLGNEFIAILKDSSLVAILGIQDITQLARLRYSATFEYFETLTALALIYLFLVLVLSRFVNWFERRVAFPH